MATQWLRLWHDMPNDPKWRTISRVSKQPISTVLAVYVHLLVIASNATERGRTQNVCSEDLASALDIDTEQVDAILSAMQGRVLDGEMVSGWAKRQVEREDGSAERSKRWRDSKKDGVQAQPNATERKQTPDTDTDTDSKPNSLRELPPLDQPKEKAIVFKTWLSEIKARGERAVTDYKPIWRYCDAVKIPSEWIEIAWALFVERYSHDEKAKRKRYIDWRGVFLRAVKGNWFGLWYYSEKDGQFRLTSVGVSSDITTRDTE